MQADDFLKRIKKLIIEGKILVSSHGYDELADDDIRVREIIREHAKCFCCRLLSGDMERKFHGEKKMKKKTTKYIHEGKYVAEVEIELLYSDEGWSPYISLEDTLKLDEIRDALQQHNMQKFIDLSL